ncbi:MAG: hypothetical protein E6Q97_11220 [Desulfurellales bacterium]|nr:MAG: hypothetical protein E6Q97_11220 [Desulfurellales bacterium]
MINLLYLSGNTTGGWVTFTYHLVRSLELMGETVQIWKVGNNTEAKQRPFGYGLTYRNISASDAMELADVLIAAVAKQQAGVAEALIGNGAKVVLHDPTELKAGLAGVAVERPWVIRKAVAAQVPNSVFIRHPYVRHPQPAKPPKKQGAISISRIDFDKHTELILDANRLGADVEIRGFENRLYTKFKILPSYPEWTQSIAHYDRHDPAAAFKLLLPRKFMVDMSLIKGDGGGTQYTFLEAWDAGAVPVIQIDWLRRNDDMKLEVNCIAVGGAGSLTAAVRRKTGIAPLVEAGYKQLRKHAPKVIVPQVLEWLHG